MPRPPTGIVPEQLGHILHHNQIHGYAAFQDTPNDFLYDQRFASGRPWIDVTASPFGADPTGVLDSAAAITAAIAAAAAGINAPVFFPPGEYRVDSTIVLDGY